MNPNHIAIQLAQVRPPNNADDKARSAWEVLVQELVDDYTVRFEDFDVNSFVRLCYDSGHTASREDDRATITIRDGALDQVPIVALTRFLMQHGLELHATPHGGIEIRRGNGGSIPEPQDDTCPHCEGRGYPAYSRGAICGACGGYGVKMVGVPD